MAYFRKLQIEGNKVVTIKTFCHSATQTEDETGGREEEDEEEEDEEKEEEKEYCDSCPICMGSFNQSSRKMVVFSCGHIFCVFCGQKLSPDSLGHVKCPICRTLRLKKNFVKLNVLSLKVTTYDQKKKIKQSLKDIRQKRCIHLFKLLKEVKTTNKLAIKGLRHSKYLTKPSIRKRLPQLLSNCDLKSIEIKLKCIEQSFLYLCRDLDSLNDIVLSDPNNFDWPSHVMKKIIKKCIKKRLN